jgi:hypothetical protein
MKLKLQKVRNTIALLSSIIHSGEQYTRQSKETIEAIKILVELEESLRWRKTEEEKPELGEDVLVKNTIDNFTTVAWMIRGEKLNDIWEDGRGFFGIVNTYWMPLPKSPVT